MKRRFIALAGPAALGALMASSSPLALAQAPDATGQTAAQPAAEVPPAEAPKPVANGNVVVRIQVAGTRRIEESTIRQYLPFTEGDRYSDALGDTALKALTATGLFAECIEHEVDHLEGNLYFDLLDNMDKLMPVRQRPEDNEDEKVEDAAKGS